MEHIIFTINSTPIEQFYKNGKKATVQEILIKYNISCQKNKNEVHNILSRYGAYFGEAVKILREILNYGQIKSKIILHPIALLIHIDNLAKMLKINLNHTLNNIYDLISAYKLNYEYCFQIMVANILPSKTWDEYKKLCNLSLYSYQSKETLQIYDFNIIQIRDYCESPDFEDFLKLLSYDYSTHGTYLFNFAKNVKIKGETISLLPRDKFLKYLETKNINYPNQDILNHLLNLEKYVTNCPEYKEDLLFSLIMLRNHRKFIITDDQIILEALKQIILNEYLECEPKALLNFLDYNYYYTRGVKIRFKTVIVNNWNLFIAMLYNYSSSHNFYKNQDFMNVNMILDNFPNDYQIGIKKSNEATNKTLLEYYKKLYTIHPFNTDNFVFKTEEIKDLFEDILGLKGRYTKLAIKKA